MGVPNWVGPDIYFIGKTFFVCEKIILKTTIPFYQIHVILELDSKHQALLILGYFLEFPSQVELVLFLFYFIIPREALNNYFCLCI